MAASSKRPVVSDQTLGSDARGFSFALEETAGRLELRALHRPDYGNIHADWSSAEQRRRISAGRKQLLARAAGLQKHPAPLLLDATAGLGRDGFTLAWLGARVTMLERHPQIAALLQDAHRRALVDPQLAPVAAGIAIHTGDAALLFTPEDPQKIAESVLKVLYDAELRKTLTTKGFEQAKKFSWKENLKKTLDIYKG